MVRKVSQAAAASRQAEQARNVRTMIKREGKSLGKGASQQNIQQDEAHSGCTCGERMPELCGSLIWLGSMTEKYHGIPLQLNC